VDAYTFTKQAKKFKHVLSAKKLIASVLWDSKVVSMVQFMQQGSTLAL
jgi:hypothetical protein